MKTTYSGCEDDGAWELDLTPSEALQFLLTVFEFGEPRLMKNSPERIFFTLSFEDGPFCLLFEGSPRELMLLRGYIEIYYGQVCRYDQLIHEFALGTVGEITVAQVLNLTADPTFRRASRRGRVLVATMISQGIVQPDAVRLALMNQLTQIKPAEKVS